MTPPERTRWLVCGKVQGVGFRWHVASAARRLSVSGWVRNLPDGRVEVTAEGPPGGLAQLEAEIRKGPRSAVVESVEKSHLAGDVAIPNIFEIR